MSPEKPVPYNTSRWSVRPRDRVATRILTPHWPQTAVESAGAALKSAAAREKRTVFMSTKV